MSTKTTGCPPRPFRHGPFRPICAASVSAACLVNVQRVSCARVAAQFNLVERTIVSFARKASLWVGMATLLLPSTASPSKLLGLSRL